MDGTSEFHELIRRFARPGAAILEIGAGPTNPTSAFLASLGVLHGLDVSDEVRDNEHLASTTVYLGGPFPLPTAMFDLCVSNYVLEHVEVPERHFAEVARVLKPGAFFVARTPNRLHYVAGAASLLPHRVHVLVANRLRGLPADAHDPWPTYYRANTPARVRSLAAGAGLQTVEMRLIEKEPSYGRAHPVLFFPMMAYERIVNRWEALSRFRANILLVLRKAG